MSTILIIVLAVTLVTLVALILPTTRTAESRRKLRPGPRPLPIIGNLHMLTNLPHHALRDLAQKYGPIMSLRLGQVPAVVVSSSHTARLFLKTHDAVFANRPHVHLLDHTSYGTKSMAFTASGPYWRGVRKLCTVRLLSASKTESFAATRRKEVAAVMAQLRGSAAACEVVDLSKKVGELVVDMSCRMILGTNLEDRYRLRELVHEALRLLGSFNLADFLPFLEPLDIQGYSRSAQKINKEIDEVLEKIIMDHELAESKQQRQCDEDFVDLLISFLNKPMNPHDEHAHVLDRTNIKAILLDMVVASFETSFVSIEWTVSELLKNPRVMKKLQQEIEREIGLEKMVEEKDLENLHYLDMVIKESFRLHPVAPLLLPRESMEDITIEGYQILKKSRIIVNTWALGRDQNVWSENVEEFYPERFRESNVDLHGHDFLILPFGFGRRGCPGVNLGLVTVRFVVAQLVHCFTWELPNGVDANEIDMIEKFGLSVGRANHLLAKPNYRLLH